MATTDDQSGASTASDQPGATNGATPDLEDLVTRVAAAVTSQFDQRFQGFQSVQDKKLSALSREFKTARLSPEEQAQLDEETNDDELARLRLENQIYRSREQFPRGADLLSKLTQAESIEDQLAIIEAFASAAAPQAEAPEAPVADGEVLVPEVDRNSPGRPVKQGARSAIESGEMNEEIADAILGIAG